MQEVESVAYFGDIVPRTLLLWLCLLVEEYYVYIYLKRITTNSLNHNSLFRRYRLFRWLYSNLNKIKKQKHCDIDIGDCSIRIQIEAVVASKELQKLKQLCVTAQLHSKSITGLVVNIVEQMLQILGLLLHAKTFYLLVTELERKVYDYGGISC